MFADRRLDRLERKLDAIMRHLQIPDAPAPQPGTPVLDGARTAEIEDLLARGKKIQAIKVYRELNPAVSLKEAKAAVEAMERR
ncbi:hypothetical protein [Nocardia sp. BMG51109]|uniref:hypothetical protein n=1 Tax=Nocardia sp. BMG51109 TaxID=1056816 RepID=UPI000463406F|nr:hypothetical protein [Nocardia sp. BMG51109]